MKTKKHNNISFFIPNLGCPHKCSFCEQSRISGTTQYPSFEEVEKTLIIEYNRSSVAKRRETEIAFFGGSFTAIDKELMLGYLKVAEKFLGHQGFYGIRISTRPDAINNEILTLLKKYGVTSIELGCQSMDDDVLKLNLRGHTKTDTKAASKLIKKYSFELGLQMMIGMPGQSEDSVYKTACLIAKLKPKTVRIYPVLVIQNTLLEKWYYTKAYLPLKLNIASQITANLLIFFNKKNIRVIRVGLHSQQSLEKSTIAGPYHPAFGEIVRSEIYLRKMIKAFSKKNKGRYTVIVCKSHLSKAVGQKKSNIKELQKLGYILTIKPDDNIKEYKLKIIG